MDSAVGVAKYYAGIVVAVKAGDRGGAVHCLVYHDWRIRQIVSVCVEDVNGAVGGDYDDLAFAIDWPAKPSVISDKDKNWPLLA